MDRLQFDAFLLNEAEKAGAKVLFNTDFQHSELLEAGAYKLHLLENKISPIKVMASVIVDASGQRAVFATERGSKKLFSDPLICLCTRFSIDNNPEKFSKLTHLESVEDGWWYAARIPGNQLLVAFYTNAETIKAKRLNKINNFLSTLKQSSNTSKLTDKLELIDEQPKGFPAPSYCLNKATGTNWLAIGDAAAAFDPITSQGIIKAMSNAIIAAETIERNKDIIEKDFSKYQNYLSSNYANYVSMRKRFYQMEMRWPSNPFWIRYQDREAVS